MLTQERLKEVLSYDSLKGVFTWKSDRSRTAKAGARAGKITKLGYRVIGIDGMTYRASRLAWLYVTGQWPISLLDHRDLNRSNDAIANLRDATMAQNLQNTALRASNASGYKGVSRYGMKWRAEITVNWKAHRLGVFSNPIDAAHAYDKAAKRLHGEFARTNF